MSDLKQGPMTWEEAAAFDDLYATVLASEHGNHQLYVNEHGTIRWEEDPEREAEIMSQFGAKDLNDLFMKGADSNDLLIRELYKCMGYSLSGFWEVFYWEVNNENAHKFRGKNYDETKKAVKLYIMIETDVDNDTDAFSDEVEEYLKEKYKVNNVEWDE